VIKVEADFLAVDFEDGFCHLILEVVFVSWFLRVRILRFLKGADFDSGLGFSRF
jgi:hypothetical protein